MNNTVIAIKANPKINKVIRDYFKPDDHHQITLAEFHKFMRTFIGAKYDKNGRWGVKNAVDKFAINRGLEVTTEGIVWIIRKPVDYVENEKVMRICL